MKHEECESCKHASWVAKIGKKWMCECMRPKFWGILDEDNEICESYQFYGWEENE